MILGGGGERVVKAAQGIMVHMIVGEILSNFRKMNRSRKKKLISYWHDSQIHQRLVYQSQVSMSTNFFKTKKYHYLEIF